MIWREFSCYQKVRVKLTETGTRMYKEAYKHVPEEIRVKFNMGDASKHTDLDGYFHIDLFDLMEIFGNQCTPGASLPFEDVILIGFKE